MKKKIIVLLVMIIIMVVAAIGWLKNSPRYPARVQESKRAVIPTSVPATMSVSGVTVSNFYVNAREVSDTGDVLLVETPEFSISFLSEYEKFIITITDPEFSAARASAEQSFLNLLRISKTEACRLTVEESVPITFDTEYAGGVYYLSFCEPT